MRTLFAVPLAALSITSVLHAQGASSTAALKWGPAPAVFPAGAKMAVVSGDPGKAVQFTIQLSMPAGYRIPPHFHPTDEHVEIVKGTFLVGMGDKFDLKHTNAMAVGDTGTIPANGHHYAAAKSAVVVAVTAMGPFAMTYLNPKDDPRNAKPAGY